MTTFTVWKFEDPDGAEHAATMLKSAQEDGLVKIVDHAVVSWPVGATADDLPQARRSQARGWLGGTLGGVGRCAVRGSDRGGVVGAGLGALSKTTEGTGITKDDLARIRTEVVEGTSALFVVSEEGSLDRLGERFRGVNMSLINTNLTEAERATLLETFGEG